MNYASLTADEELENAITIAPFVLVLIIRCLSIGVMLVCMGRHAVGMMMISSVLFAVGLVNMVAEKTMTPLLIISVILFCCTFSHMLISTIEFVVRLVRHRQN